MKTFATLALAVLAVANPVAIDQRAPDEIAAAEVEKRATGTTSKEFSLFGCRDVIFVWARGSTELGNMVITTFDLYWLCTVGLYVY